MATMFHDAGAMEPDRSDGGRCFTLKGAADAESHLAAAGWPAERCAAAAEAITLHLNPAVPLERGPEAHLMHDGVLLDAVGLRAWELRKDAIERVRARHPRLRFSQDGGRLLARAGTRDPGLPHRGGAGRRLRPRAQAWPVAGLTAVRSSSTARAARNPGAPVTAPPGCAPEPAR